MNQSLTKQRKRRTLRRRLTPTGNNGFFIKSLTRADDTRYTVTISEHNVISCTCPAAQFNPGKLCKHGLRALAWQERHQPAAVRSTGPVCVSCGQMDALHWLTTAEGKPICADCAHDSLPFSDDDFEQQANQGEAEYFRNLAMAESYGAFCEQRANEEAAEYEDEEGAPC